LSCLVLSCLVLSCLVLSCLVLSCLVLSCTVLSRLALLVSSHRLVLPCLVLSCLGVASLVICCLAMCCVVLSSFILAFSVRVLFYGQRCIETTEALGSVSPSCPLFYTAHDMPSSCPCKFYMRVCRSQMTSFPMTAVPDSNGEIATEMSVESNKMKLEQFIERTRNNLPLKQDLVDGENKELLIGHIINMDQVGQALVVAYEKPPRSMFKTLHGLYTLQPLQNPDSRVTEYLTGPESKFWSLAVPRHGMFHGAGGFEVGYRMRGGWESDATLSTTVLCSAEGDKEKRGMHALYQGIANCTGPIPPYLFCWSWMMCVFGAPCTAVCMYPCIERNNSDSHHIRLRENNVLVQVDSHIVMPAPGNWILFRTAP
jgi:hypothetical protein